MSNYLAAYLRVPLLAFLWCLLTSIGALATELPDTNIYYPFDYPTHISKPHERARHLAFIEAHDTAARLFRNHPGLKIEGNPVFESASSYRDMRYSMAMYTYYLPIAAGRQVVSATYAIADNITTRDVSFSLASADISVTDLTAASLDTQFLYRGPDNSISSNPQVTLRYQDWRLSTGQLAALLSETNPVFVPSPATPKRDRWHNADNNIFEHLVKPNRYVDASDTGIVVEGTLPPNLSREQAAGIAVATIAEADRLCEEWHQQIRAEAAARRHPPRKPPLNSKPETRQEIDLSDVLTDFNTWQVPAGLRNAHAREIIGRRLNPIVYLYPYAPNRLLARIVLARFAAQRDPTIITRQFDGWSSHVASVIVEWDGTRWRGHQVMGDAEGFTIYN